MSKDKPNININVSGQTLIGKIIYGGENYSGASLRYSSVVDSTKNTLKKEFIEQLKNEPDLMQNIINSIADEVTASKLEFNYSVDYAGLPAILVLNYAVEVFENSEVAQNWLKRPNKALGEVIPLDLLDTEQGVQQVYELLNRIEYGVYS
ncbi:antitoxin Xre/MbcA/ParS toxin-binding domain-containing protein [Gloeothece verrucosa]|uniref:Antitoxin Xre/MbcA/ParS-like toxin-binding domain-containing protein n=1 Tax=Gloeothece verrucosa (strain PCC 7822) TaxID=497965 RepID=E0UIG6_GLOV7|nr:MbcA/ParS/Xre antitoxin family protein [Gloeothece verrucosa]ADN12160.1 conserved hypothetical protein [Gloeothece verrucosa PCC 7822]